MIAARIPFAAVAGVFCSLAVFFGLWRLVGGPLDIEPTMKAPVFEFTRPRIEQPVRIVEPVTEPIRRLPPPILGTPGIGPSSDELVVKMRYDPIGPLGRPGRDFVGDEGGIVMGVDRDVVPLVRVNPEYPPPAAAREIEGWVRVQFDVTQAGTVRNAFVVAAEPRGTFDAAALEAVARWRYNPRIANGTAIDRVGLQTKFVFTLDGPR